MASNIDAAAASSFSIGGKGANSNIVQVQIPPSNTFRSGTNHSQIVSAAPPGQMTNGAMQAMSQSPQTSSLLQNLNGAVDARSFIKIKNRVEENSKQLKHDVAQQIIASQSSNAANSAKARINSHHARKSSLINVPPG